VLCNRVLVFRDHALAAELAGDAMRSGSVIAAMFGRTE
jgi:ribose transport system ATP-binding protein